MRASTPILCSMCLVLVAACATPSRKTVNEVILGMSTDQVSAVLGDPSKQSTRKQSTREIHAAWRYEDIVRVEPCSRRFSGCRNACEHILIWFERDVVVAVTAHYVSSLAKCGDDDDPVRWDRRPNHSLLCFRDRFELLAPSDICTG
jgi:hypothetical protein